MTMNITMNNYNVNIIRKNIKHTYIRVKNNEIVVTTNYLTPKIYINKLIKDNAEYLEKTINHQKKKEEKNKDFYLFGTKYNIIYDTNYKNVVIENNNIITPNDIVLTKYLDSIIKETFSKQLSLWYNTFEEKLPVPNLKIRKMKSRWGVCNIKNNNVTLNYYLYKYNKDCLDYVIVHELSHFLEGNHSKNFWKIVEKYYPNYKETRKKLRS